MILAMCVLLSLFTLRAGSALGDVPLGAPSQHTVIEEVVHVANKFIEHSPCEPSLAEPSVVATMIPYTRDVAAARAVAEYVVLWSGDIDCRNGSGTYTQNFLLIDKIGADTARIVGVGEIVGAANIERIVATAPDSLTIDVYTHGPDDPVCCASLYERWTLRREPSPQIGRYTLKTIDEKPAQPVPLAPGEKKLPTAKFD
jgi:hypothetical protein